MSTTVHPTYPVHVEAELQSGLSRWLWLVKWLLVIPHYLVLAFLWVAFVLLSVVAFFAILFAGRYPRGIFEFNVGVLRWTWRVGYYAYAALGTDRYPPFTLEEVPDYPAHLSVDYPDHLSRGLVLVKWWLLAIPHYIVVGFLAGSGAYLAWDASDSDRAAWAWGGGLIGLLVLVAAVVLLVTGTYPRQVFDLVLGLNRWVLRVAAYAALMTDEYPPFRLDQGGADPGGAARVLVPAGPPSGAAGMAERADREAAPLEGPTPSTTTSTWAPGRVITVVVGGMVFLLAGGLLTAGATIGIAGAVMRDDSGFWLSPEGALSTSSYAVVSEPLVLDPGSSSDFVPQALLGEVTVRATGDAGPVFVGIASANDVAAYLDGVSHATLVDFEGVGGEASPVYREHAGGAPALAPTESDIWAASAYGTGEQELFWDPEGGDWVVVLMNADGAAAVAADVSVGATMPVLGWVALGLFVGGAVLLVVSIGIVLAGIYAGRGRSTAPVVPSPPRA